MPRPELHHGAHAPRRLTCFAPASATALLAAVIAVGAQATAHGAVSGSDLTPVPPVKGAARDSAMTLKGGAPGTVFRTLTVEGEDRVHLDIERPVLRLDLDPHDAPGLDLGTARDVLDRTVPDLLTPLLESVAREPSAFTARPWLSEFSDGPVARFRPDVSDVEAWRLLIADSRGRTVATFEGRRRPPKEIVWDGRTADGAFAVPGLTYSYVLEAEDRAGNRRNFMGEGFELPAYRRATDRGPVLLLPGRVFAPHGAATADDAARMLAEAASWLNQVDPAEPVQIVVAARRYETGEALAARVAEFIRPRLLGDVSRIRTRVDVQPDAPGAATVTLRTGSE